VRSNALVFALLFFVLLSVNLAGVPRALAAGPYSADSPAALTFVSQTVDIDYGNKITVTTVVETDKTSIDSVRALFRPRGGSTIWSYYYPDFAVEANRISLTFDISTGPGSYFPPGTEFEIEIEVTQADGEISFAKSPAVIEYLDPAIDWQRVDGEGYSIVYFGVPLSDVNSLIGEVNARIPTLRSVLGVEDASDFPAFKAVVFPSVSAATPSFPPVSQTATDQLLFAGFAQPQYRLFVQGQMSPTTFIHELAHLYTHEVLSSSLQTGIPSWLGEGLARYLETGSSSSSNARLRSSVEPDELLSLRHMGTIPGRRSDIFIFYPQAGAFVGYLVEEYGAGSMASYLAAMNAGQSLLSGFEQVFGKSLYEVENEWRARFDASPLAIPTVTPEPTLSTESESPSTPVPLVDYRASSQGISDSTSELDSTNSAGAAVPVFLPTVTPPSSGDEHSERADSQATGLSAQTGNVSDPNYLVAGLVIGLSILTGLWLFTSRRSKLPKRKT